MVVEIVMVVVGPRNCSSSGSRNKPLQVRRVVVELVVHVVVVVFVIALLIQYYYHKRSCCVMLNITSSLTYCKLLNHCFQASKTFSSTVFKQGAYSFQIKQFRQGISLSMCLEFLRSACDILVTKLMKPTLKGNKTWVLFWFQTYLPPWHFILNLPKQ